MDDDVAEAMNASSKPTKKSDFANRTFKNTQEFCQKFIQEEEFVDVVKEIQQDSMLTNVRLFVIMEEFKQYKRTNNISADQFKKSLKKVICAELHKAHGHEACPNDKIKMDQIAKKLVKVFDANKNGKLEYQEAVSAFCTLCRGSVQSKLKYQMLAYSECIDSETLANAEDADADPTKIVIRLKNLRKYILCVLKLALCSSSEIILDYPVEKLATATAEKCLEYCGVTDKKEGKVTLAQVAQFVATSNTMAIFAPAEGNDPNQVSTDS